MAALRASVRGKGVAADTRVEQAIADLSARADDFLRRLHDGKVADARAVAEMHLHALREYVRRTGADLEAVASWRRNTTCWRAVARLAASPVIKSEQRA